MELGWIDGLVLVTLLLLAIAIGFLSGRKNRDLEGYLLGGRSLPWWAILGSIVATETSTATVLSIPGVGLSETGMQWLQITFGFVLGRAIVVAVFLPLYFDGKLMTAYQVLDRRLGHRVKSTASGLFLVTRNLGDGLRLFLAGAVLEAIFGWPLAGCVIAMGIVTITYTFFGGLRSVVWNDCIQFVIYIIGGVAAVFLLIRLIPGGWDEAIRFADETGRLRLTDWTFSFSNPYNVWAGLIGGAVLTIGTHGTDHMMVQRYLGARSRRDAGRAVFLSSLVVMAQFALFLWIGVLLGCFYSTAPLDPSIKPDQVFAHFIVDHFPKNVGLIGLMLAAILAAAMSTLSSSLSASVSAFVNDFYVPMRGRRNAAASGRRYRTISISFPQNPLRASRRSVRVDRSPPNLLRFSRFLTIVFGVLQIGIGIWASTFSESVINNALAIAGFSAGLLLGIFLLGISWRSIGQNAVLLGTAVGTVVLVLVSFILRDDAGRPWVAWPWMAAIGSVTTFVAGTLAGWCGCFSNAKGD
jgi:SSS family transporter